MVQTPRTLEEREKEDLCTTQRSRSVILTQGSSSFYCLLSSVLLNNFIVSFSRLKTNTEEEDLFNILVETVDVLSSFYVRKRDQVLS